MSEAFWDRDAIAKCSDCGQAVRSKTELAAVTLQDDPSKTRPGCPKCKGTMADV